MGHNLQESDSGIPMSWISPTSRESSGRAIKLARLTPKFDEKRHRVYYDLLSRAVDDEGVRNVALTGAYGTGKSSVLDELRRHRERDIVEISLSTISPPRHGDRDDNAGNAEINLIQKEIVKQLLYRLPSHKTPRSKFRRASKPRTAREWTFASLASALMVTLALVLGLLQPLVEPVVSEPWGRPVLVYIVIAGALAWIISGVRRLLTGGSTMSASVGAGITSVTLSSASSTYFDEYLDEIVYFFQASRTKIVVIEDIDRFDDVEIFDTLRALNVLLNSSSSLDRIVFVYAIRDSVFEAIEGVHNSDNDPVRQAVRIGGRPKFFDVIIPVVPFVNADNARDLMSRAMKSDDFSISPAVIRMSARYAADMRLIHNIRNEFEVYRNRLIAPRAHVYGISDDLVFAMVVFKNVFPSDFEKIRHKNSMLDRLYESWRELVRVNLNSEVDRLNKLRGASMLGETAEKRAQQWARLFQKRVHVLESGLQAVHGSGATFGLVGELDESKLRESAVWTAIASGEPLRLRAKVPQGQTLSFTFAIDQLAVLLGIPLQTTEWESVDSEKVEKEILACEENVRFLRHHTWEELAVRPEFTLQHGDKELTFNDLISAELRSPLVEELVRHGFITSHFALYTSMYYGTHLGPEALEYVRRCVEPGKPDILFELSEDAVQQLLTDQGAENDDAAEVFRDPSMRNVSIVDYLLKHRPLAVGPIAKELATWGTDETEFVATYCSKGQEPGSLLAALAAYWSGILQYTIVQAPLPAEKRVPAVDAVLSVLVESITYSVDTSVKEFLEEHAAQLVSLISPASSDEAAIRLGIFLACDARFLDVAPLNSIARDFALDNGLYAVTRENLLELNDHGSIALDKLRDTDKRVYAHAVAHLNDYLDAFSEDATAHTIENPLQFAEILRQAGRTGAAVDVRRLVSYSSANCVVPELTEVPSVVWPTIMAMGRTSATFRNIQSYIDDVGAVDEALATFFERHDIIECDEDNDPLEDRRRIAQHVLNASDVLPNGDVRIELALQLAPGEFPADGIVADRGTFAKRLIEEQLVPDDEETFSSSLMADWSSREGAIAASGGFASFVSPKTLPASQVPLLLTSALVPLDAKKRVVQRLTEYLSSGTKAEAEEIASALNKNGWRVASVRIEALIGQGVSAAQIIPLLARSSSISSEDMRALLRTMGQPYSSLADPSHRPVYVPNDRAHHELIDRLRGVTVSSVKEDGAQIRVNLVRKER